MTIQQTIYCRKEGTKDSFNHYLADASKLSRQFKAVGRVYSVATLQNPDQELVISALLDFLKLLSDLVSRGKSVTTRNKPDKDTIDFSESKNLYDCLQIV